MVRALLYRGGLWGGVVVECNWPLRAEPRDRTGRRLVQQAQGAGRIKCRSGPAGARGRLAERDGGHAGLRRVGIRRAVGSEASGIRRDLIQDESSMD